MIDSSLMPPLPDPTEKTESWRDEYGYEKWDYAFSEAQMKAYGLQCYQLAMERAAQECQAFSDEYMNQARGGDRSGASDHKACAAAEIADAIRALALQEKTT